MNDLKQAYATLGLPESASREEVERTFDMELIKSKGRSNTAESRSSGESEFELKLRAYKFIVQEEDRRIVAKKSQERYSKWGKFAGKAEKTDDFFRLYKTHVIVSIVALVAIIFGVNAFIDHRAEQKRLASLPPVDLSILYIGNYMTNESGENTEALEAAMLSQFPEFKRLDVKLNYLPLQGDNSAAMVYQQKAMAILASERPDIYVVDKPTFEWINQVGAFQPLDLPDADALKPLLNDSNTITASTEEDPSKRVYGINVTNSSLIEQLPLGKDDVIFTISVNSQNREKALLLIQRYLETTD